MSDKLLTWEEAVDWLKLQSDKQKLVKECYYDDPLIEAAKRFAESEEWHEIKKIVYDCLPGKVLDLGAGNGISSFAFASLGFDVTALEPDPSNTVGAGAIKKLVTQANVSINVVEGVGEILPFNNNFFDVVYCRQVLHHAEDLEKLCKEAARVLRPGGIFLATREHVISKVEDLDKFLQKHPLHSIYGGENALLKKEYLAAIEQADLKINRIYGPYDSAINYFPKTTSDIYNSLINFLSKIIGKNLARFVVSQKFLFIIICRMMNLISNDPGRLYTFVSSKPKERVL